MPYSVLIRIPQSRVDCHGGNPTRMEHMIKAILDLDPNLKNKVWGPCKNKYKLLHTKRIAPEGQRSSTLVNNTTVLRREHLNVSHIQKYPATLLQDILALKPNTPLNLTDLKGILNLKEANKLTFENLYPLSKDLLSYNTDAVFMNGEWSTSKTITANVKYDLDWNRHFMWKYLKFKPRDLILILDVLL